jgi:hypothetical protein
MARRLWVVTDGVPYALTPRAPRAIWGLIPEKWSNQYIGFWGYNDVKNLTNIVLLADKVRIGLREGTKQF